MAMGAVESLVLHSNRFTVASNRSIEARNDVTVVVIANCASLLAIQDKGMRLSIIPAF